MKTPAHLDPTIVTANGKVAHVGRENDGLIVVSADDGKPIMSFDEVTGDDEVVHVFCNFAPGAAFGPLDMDNPDEEHAQLVGTDGFENTHEIIIRKDQHQPLVPVSPNGG